MTSFNVVPIGSTSKRVIATTSRRRRIIYETSRRLANKYQEQGKNRALRTISSTKIQSYIRKCLAKSRLKTDLRRRNYATIRLQSIFRGTQVRNKLRLRTQTLSARETLAMFFRLVRKKKGRIKTKILTSAAIVIQKHFRGSMAREKIQEMQLLQLHMECAAIVIQSFVRKFAYISSRYREIHKPKAILIQKYLRGHFTRKYWKRILRSVQILQIWFRQLAFHKASDTTITLISLKADEECKVEDNISEVSTTTFYASQEDSSECISDCLERNNPELPHCNPKEHYYYQEEEDLSDFVSFSFDDDIDRDEPSPEKKHIFYEKILEVKTILTCMFTRQNSAILIQRCFRLFMVERIRVRMAVLRDYVQRFVGKAIGVATHNVREKGKSNELRIATMKIQSYARLFMAQSQIQQLYTSEYERILDIYQDEFPCMSMRLFVPAVCNNDGNEHGIAMIGAENSKTVTEFILELVPTSSLWLRA